MARWHDFRSDITDAFRNGVAIPASPLALNEKRELDRRRQRALARYYVDAGVGGLAVGVHTTQFAIRQAGLYKPVLEIAAAAVSDWADRPIVLVAGVAGKTEQALAEARLARDIGYHAALVSLAAFGNAGESALVEHCAAVADIMPVVGFYLQTAVGGRRLSRAFWRRLAGIENVVGVKMAPFNRYQTLDVIRGIVEARAEHRVSLYTGNDDHIVLDLLTTHEVERDGETIRVPIVGGLLGHWSIWTQGAVRIFERCTQARLAGDISPALLTLDGAVTDCNAAVFDVRNDFAGVIAGCHEILRRQGLLEGTWCLDPDETLGDGQAEEIDRICREHAELADDDFVAANIDRWMG